MKLVQRDAKQLQVLCIGELRLAFSHETLIGWINVQTRMGYLAINEWSKTTARHINLMAAEWNFDHDRRVPAGRMLSSLYLELHDAT